MTMTPALTAAAERLISLPGFCWMPGMVDVEGYRIIAHTDDGSFLVSYGDGAFWTNDVALPDLTDPATLGCVLAMVREAWGTQRANCYMTWPEECWACNVQIDGVDRFLGRTEAECLVNALAAAAGGK